ncbi:hypothetical protein EON63_13425 [archaeon]|nr:MAG: hypothetical protein EON63_13425 [archaeon]
MVHFCTWNANGEDVEKMQRVSPPGSTRVLWSLGMLAMEQVSVAVTLQQELPVHNPLPELDR